MIPKSFELASGLKVNFSKSCIFRFIVMREFLDLVEDIFHWKVDSLPFKD